jgi:hypothetical protein
MLIDAGEDEMLPDDSVRLVKPAQQRQVAVGIGSMRGSPQTDYPPFGMLGKQ